MRQAGFQRILCTPGHGRPEGAHEANAELAFCTSRFNLLLNFIRKPSEMQGKSYPVHNDLSQRFRPGDRVRIRAHGDFGSVRLLHGLTGEVVGPHPFARGWLKLRLDTNDITPHLEWSAPEDRLIHENRAEHPERPLRVRKTVTHFP